MKNLSPSSLSQSSWQAHAILVVPVKAHVLCPSKASFTTVNQRNIVFTRKINQTQSIIIARTNYIVHIFLSLTHVTTRLISQTTHVSFQIGSAVISHCLLQNITLSPPVKVMESCISSTTCKASYKKLVSSI